jgi:hypothetical protein
MMMNTLTLVMLPLVCIISHMLTCVYYFTHAHTLSIYIHTHTANEFHRRLKEFAHERAAGRATPEQLQFLQKREDGCKYLVHTIVFIMHDVLVLMICHGCFCSICVFLLTLSSSYIFSPSLHTHTGKNGGKYVCVYLYMYW